MEEKLSKLLEPTELYIEITNQAFQIQALNCGKSIKLSHITPHSYGRPPFGIGLIAHFVLVVIQLKHNGPCGPKHFWALKPKTNLKAQYEHFV